MKKTILELYNQIEPNLKSDFISNIYHFHHYTFINPAVLQNKREHNDLDSYLGVIYRYNLEHTIIQNGRGWAPILYRIQKCEEKKIFSHQLSNLLIRKVTYIKLSSVEMKYLLDRYNWKKLPECKDIFISKFEDIISTSFELLLLILNNLDTKYKNFNCIIDQLPKEKNNLVLHSENTYIYLSLLMYLRHKIVHDPTKIIYTKLGTKKPMISLKDIHILDKETKEMIEVIKRYFNNFYIENKKANQKIILHEFIIKNLEYSFKLNKNKEINEETISIKYNQEIMKTTEDILGELFIIEREILNKILKIRAKNGELND